MFFNIIFIREYKGSHKAIRIEWANYIWRHSFLAHLLFPLSLRIICLDLWFRQNCTSTQKRNYIPGFYNVTTSINWVILAVEVSSVWTAPGGQFAPTQCAAGSIPVGGWYKKHFYALSVWLTPEEFICCLSCEKENWQFSYSGLGWIFTTDMLSLEPYWCYGRLKTYCSFCLHSAPSLTTWAELAWISPALGPLLHVVGSILSVHIIPPCRGQGSRTVL